MKINGKMEIDRDKERYGDGEGVNIRTFCWLSKDKNDLIVVCPLPQISIIISTPKQLLVYV